LSFKKYLKIVFYLTVFIDLLASTLYFIVLFFYKSFGITNIHFYINIGLKFIVKNILISNLSFKVDIYAVLFFTTTIFIINFLLFNLHNSQNFIYSIFLKFFALGAFSANNLITVAVFMEASALVVFVWLLQSPYDQKTIAANSYFIYSSLGSFFLILSSCFPFINCTNNLFTTTSLSSVPVQNKLLILSLLGFLIKLPTAPFQQWLLQAHTEANTAGSVVLASILLKISAFGLFRLIAPIQLNYLPTFLIVLCCTFSVWYVLTILWFESDLKRIVAHSSIVHMNIYILTYVYLKESIGINFIFILLVHSILVSLLFFLFGCLMARTHSRNYKQFSGILTIVPKLNLYILVTLFFYGAFPITVIFLLEFFLSYSYLKYSIFFAILVLIIFSFIFLKLLLVYSSLSTNSVRPILVISDINFREACSIYILLLLLFYICLVWLLALYLG
jgi:NADH-quinone oxidoreductase subunit M